MCRTWDLKSTEQKAGMAWSSALCAESRPVSVAIKRKAGQLSGTASRGRRTAQPRGQVGRG